MFVSRGACILSRKKLLGLAKHVGVQLPSGAVAHLHPTTGVTVSSLADFAAGEQVSREREISPHVVPQLLSRLKRANSERRPYDPIAWNCEHFVNWLVDDSVKSPQALAWIIVGGLVGLVFAIRQAS